jgi:2-polyprenyl-3-methyl-5-hydroxy-6-metoxy-1,4-benzoquinol methylase
MAPRLSSYFTRGWSTCQLASIGWPVYNLLKHLCFCLGWDYDSLRVSWRFSLKGKDKSVNNLAFACMTFVFKIRDLIRPPKDKLLEIGIEPGAQVLDYGCGPGAFSVEAAKLVGEGGKVYAVDIHPSAIRSVKQRAAAASLTNIVPIEADSPAGLETESMDVVILYDIYHHFPDPDAIARELHRVMKPEAVLSFSDHHMKEDAILSGMTKDGLFELSKKGNRTHSFRKTAPNN